MADNRKYYYLKLKESYFDEDAIVLLESMQDGIEECRLIPLTEEIADKYRETN